MTNRATIAATAAAGIPGPATGFLDDPRTFGLRFTIKYEIYRWCDLSVS
jgi:iron complex outermembrane receptor protein